MQRVLFFLCFYLFSLGLHAQNWQMRVKMRTGIRHFSWSDFRKAEERFLEVYQEDTSIIETRFLLGAIYLMSDELAQYHKAVPHLAYVMKEDVNYHPELQFMYARALHYDGQFDEAIEQYQGFLNNGDTHHKEIVARTNGHIEEARFAKEMVLTPSEYAVKNAGDKLNSEYRDYMPVISENHDMLIFTSNRKHSSLKKDITGNHYEDVFLSKIGKDDEWLEPVTMEDGVNTRGHDASVYLSENGKDLYIYSDDNQDILKTSFDGKKWSEPKPVKGDQINTENAELSASFTRDRKKMYFNSDRPGGIGGLDIYVSEYDEASKSWSEPINLGSPINTPENEESPFVLPDGNTLYFSSKGHKTMGGYDVFKAELNDGQWSSPINLGYPINSPADDLYFVIFEDGQVGYLSSRRPGGSGDIDIYKVFLPRHKDFQMVALEDQRYNFGLTTDKDKAEEFVASLSKQLGLEEPMDEEENQRLVDLIWIDPYESQKLHDQDIQSRYDSQEDKEIHAKGILMSLNMDKNNQEKLNTVKSILEEEQPFDQEGDLMAKENDQQEDQTMVSAIPSTSEEEKSKDSEQPYTSNSSNSNSPNKSAKTDNQTTGQQRPSETMQSSFPSGFILGKVYFATNQSAILDGNKEVLDALVDLMKKYPNLNSIVVGHSDNVGDEKYNNTLSLRRSQEVVNYLVSKGINSERLELSAKGEKDPQFSNENEGGRQLNRRAEVVVK